MRLFGNRKQKTTEAQGRRKVMFVSHEATRTGAPKIILKILKHFRQTCDIECETLLQQGGHLACEFEQHSVVDCFNTTVNQPELIKKRVNKTLARLKQNRPILAICNSMESRHIANQLSINGIPCVSLVHELPSSYTEDDYQCVFDASRKVVFPVHAVREAADAKTSLPLGKSVVLSQGLLNPDFGTGIAREEARLQIREELSLPKDAFIVLGCGTLDLRKGIDHFSAIARQVVNSNPGQKPIHFVWVGEGPRWTHSTYHYVKLDIDKSQARHFVHFVGGRDNVEPYFVGSDAFLMSSRVDPFPCVIHEAMASRLPIISFANSGGAPEALERGAGIVVPYADYTEASKVILQLADNPEVGLGLSDRAHERVHTRYRFAEYAERLIDLSESIVGQRLRTRPASTASPRDLSRVA